MKVTVCCVLLALFACAQAAHIVQIPARDLQAPHVRVVRSAQFGGFGGNPYGGGGFGPGGFGGFGGPSFQSSSANANAQSSNFGGGFPGFSGSSAQASASAGNFNFGK